MSRELRRKDREVKDMEQIRRIVDRAKVLHLGLVDAGYPYIVPLHYGYEYDTQAGGFVFYMHSAQAGHKLELICADSRACVQLETDVALDCGTGAPCSYGAYYSSFMGWGTVSLVSNPAEKKHALALLMRNQAGRTFEFTDEMAKTVAVIKAVITDYSAKARVKQD